MTTFARPTKIGGFQQYVDEVTAGYPELPARELDDDINLLYDAVNRPFIPAGPAGGDLTGIYPNPTIAAGAVGNAEITDVAWSKITGAPTSFLPTGPAGGDLTGTYPNPIVGAGKVNRSKTAADLWLPPVPTAPADVGKVLSVGAGPSLVWQTGVPGPAGGPAGGDLSGAYPDPVVLKAAGAFTVASNLSLTNGVITTIGANSGDAIKWGPSALVKGRLVSGTAVRTIEMTANATQGGTQDDATLASWRMALSPHGDQAYIGRQNPGSATVTPILTALSGGILVAGLLDVRGSQATLGPPGTPRVVVSNDPAGVAYFAQNYGFAPDDTTKASWTLRLNSAADQIDIFRRAPNAAANLGSSVLGVLSNGTVRVTADPINALDLATKQYVDATERVVVRNQNYTEFGRSSAALFTIATLPALVANQLLRVTIHGFLVTTTGTFTINVKSATGWTTAATLFFYGTVNGTIRCDLLIGQNGGGNSYSYSSLTHMVTPAAPPSGTIAANGQQQSVGYQAATGAITVSGQFSASDANNVLTTLFVVAEQL